VLGKNVRVRARLKAEGNESRRLEKEHEVAG
jgi:hypothetical protein